MTSESDHVAQFTRESGFDIPSKPTLMSYEEVHFIIKMVLDEMMELYATVSDPKEAKEQMVKMIMDSKDIPKSVNEGVALIAEQADALVDANYYMLNTGAKKGVNLSMIFNKVHEANMNKRDPATGKFLKRADGKIIKPAGWKEADIVGEVQRQMDEGAFKF